MSEKKKAIHDADLSKVEFALKRAAKLAKKIAAETQTPLVIYKDGKITRKMVEKK